MNRRSVTTVKPPMAKRFSRDTVAEAIRRHIARADSGYSFDRALGWDQVTAAAKRKASPRRLQPGDLEAASRAYGAFDALRTLAEELDLP